MAQFYSDPSREGDTWAPPDAEVFFEQSDTGFVTDEGEPRGRGWYYWYCSPGCLPDGGPIGPFATEAEAIADAREGVA